MSSPNERLRVAHLITQMELGGAQQNTLYTVTHLNSERFEPTLICGKGGMLDDEARQSGAPVYFVPSLVRPIHPIKDVWALIALYKLLRRLKPHVVHTHSSKAGILGRIAAYVAGVPVIIHTFHGFGFTPGQRPWVRRRLIQAEKFCAHLSTHLIFVAEDNRAEAAALGIGTNVPGSLIRSGISLRPPEALSRIREELGIPRDAWVVTSVGNYKPQKNPVDLGKTAAAVLRVDPSVHFIFVGDGELRPDVEKCVQAEAAAGQVHFLGWRRDIQAILSASNTFLLTSLWEGLPRALVEAFVARLPAVAYGVNGVQDILQDNLNGFLIPPGDIEKAAEKVLWLKAHALQALRMGEIGRDKIGKEFEIDFMVRQQEELYDKLYAAVPLKDYYKPRWTPTITS